MTYPSPYVNGLYGDVLGDTRTWLRAHPYLTALKAGDGSSLLNARVFFRIPKDAVFPLVRIYRAGGANLPGEAPIEDTMIGVDVWGGSYEDVVNIANAIKAAFHLMPSGTHLGSTTVGLNADLTGDIDTPDPDTGHPRKTLTVTITSRVVTANG